MGTNSRDPASGDEPSRMQNYSPAEMGFHRGDKNSSLNMNGIAVVFLLTGIFATAVLIYWMFWL